MLKTPELLHALHELEGKELGCWCAPDPCHGHELVRLLAELREGKLAQYMAEAKGEEEEKVDADDKGETPSGKRSIASNDGEAISASGGDAAAASGAKKPRKTKS